MNYRRLRTHLLASIVASVAVPVLAVGGAVLGAPTVVRAATERVDCKVHAVHLTKEGNGKIPKNLKFIEEQLKDDQFAAYKGFRLLDAKTLKLELNKPGTTKMKSGHATRLKLLGAEQKRLKLHATLTSPARTKPLISAEYVIEDKGVLMMGGFKYQGGRLLFAIQCASR
jgi:hypothetical protein